MRLRLLAVGLVLGACNNSPVTLGAFRPSAIPGAGPSPGQALLRAALPAQKSPAVLSSDARCAAGWHRESWPALSVCAKEHGEEVVILSVGITPITSLSAPPSGLVYSGDAYEVQCSVTGSVTLYPALYDSTLSSPSWTYYPGYGCALSATAAPRGTCVFPARVGSGQTFNAYLTGGGSVSGCTAAARQGLVPAGTASAGGGGGSGTVTSITCGTGLSCTPNPITAAGSVALSTTGVTPGTYGSSTAVSVTGVDAQGRLTSATSTTITPFLPGVRLTTTTPAVMGAGDYLLRVNVAGPAQVTLSDAPVGTMLRVKDASNAAANNPISVYPPSGTIDGGAVYVINTNGGCITFQRLVDGNWQVIST